MSRDLRNQIVEKAKEYVGVKYKHQGRSKEFGIDCVGLIVAILHDLNISDYDTFKYGRRPIPADFLKELNGNLIRIDTRTADHGDVCIFAEPRHPCHTAILEVDENGDEWLIHSYAPAKRVIRERLSEQRTANWRMTFKFPEPK